MMLENANMKPGKVLELGSLNVNGTIRDLFPSWDYVGIDIQDGPGVDHVMSSHDLMYPDESFDVVITTEMFEHDDAFWLTCLEVDRVLKPGGLFILTTRGNGFKRHEHPVDLWRFMPQSGAVLLRLAGCVEVDLREDPDEPGIFLTGRKAA